MIIFWFRNDLRVSDNPGFSQVVAEGRVMPIFIFENKIGGASAWWLHHSLKSLNDSLQQKLNFYRGDSLKVFKKLIERHQIEAVYWNRSYDPLGAEQENAVAQLLREKKIPFQHFNASLLWGPEQVLKKDKTPYQVFTPFYREALSQSDMIRLPISAPKSMKLYEDKESSQTLDSLTRIFHGSHSEAKEKGDETRQRQNFDQSCVSPYRSDQNSTTTQYSSALAKLQTESHEISGLNLLSKNSWHEKLHAHWKIGEQAAQQRLHSFLETDLVGYEVNRDFPGRSTTSRLSPHLHFGEISPHQIWHTTRVAASRILKKDADTFLRELAWREFSYYQLFHFPELPWKNFQSQFDLFPWKKNAENLKSWQRGKTGYPIVDAGMRELWQTGTMHNRVRMIVASFLTKNLMIDWREGASWFEDCLLDADLASNNLNWQWVAGCGVDAAPYFRIFNPILQSKKFDPNGNYIRRFIPELAKLPNKFLFTPWEAPKSILQEVGIILGKTYPFPIVDLQASREKALQAYHSL